MMILLGKGWILDGKLISTDDRLISCRAKPHCSQCCMHLFWLNSAGQADAITTFYTLEVLPHLIIEDYLFVCWSTNPRIGRIGPPILVDQMNILVDELIDQMTKK